MQLSDEDDDNDHQVTPRRRVPSVTTPSQDDSDLVVKGCYITLKNSYKNNNV